MYVLEGHLGGEMVVENERMPNLFAIRRMIRKF